MSDQFTTYDAGYLLGALTPADRAAYEAHLTECLDCRRAVNQLAGIPGLLAGVSPTQARSAGQGIPEVPDALLPRLLAEVQRARFRRRMTTVLVGAAAALVLVLTVVVGLHRTSGTPAPQQPVASAAQRMTPVSPAVPISATAKLSETAWGTKIQVRCLYHPPANSPYSTGPFTYTMVVTDRAGGTQQIAAWKAEPGAPIVVQGSTSVPRDQISSVQVRDPRDEPVLTLQL
jgi:hypothetical protein